MLFITQNILHLENANMFIVYFAIVLRKYRSICIILCLMSVLWCVARLPCAAVFAAMLSTSTREQSSSNTHIFHTRNGDGNIVRFLAKQHGLQFISKVSAYLSLLHYCHRYAWDFHFFLKNQFTQFPLQTEKWKCWVLFSFGDIKLFIKL